MTLIDSKTNMIRLANLCFVSCYKVIFSSDLQRDILLQEKDSPLKEFYSFVNKSFILIEPGVNPRKWIHNCNRDLSKLITDYIDDESEWLTHLQLLRPILSQIQDVRANQKPDPESFNVKFMDIRISNKKKLISYLQKERDDPLFLQSFDIQNTLFIGYLRKITKSARQLMALCWVIKRYLYLKSISSTIKERKDIVPRIVFLGGMSRPGDLLHLQLIKLMMVVAQKLEQDHETNQYLRLVFLPNYTTAKEYLYVPALDVNEQLVLPGKQSCSTQPLKFTMNGSIVLGSRDATNTRIDNTLGEDIVLLFGHTYQQRANKEYIHS